MLARRIEEASLNAWPALQQILYDGWVLRLAEGYTKRANSVNPLFAAHLSLPEKVAFCEALYARKGLSSIFRLTPFSSPPDLDAFLARRGYHVLDPTSVLHLDLRGNVTQPAPRSTATISPPCFSISSTRANTSLPSREGASHRSVSPGKSVTSISSEPSGRQRLRRAPLGPAVA